MNALVLLLYQPYADDWLEQWNERTATLLSLRKPGPFICAYCPQPCSDLPIADVKLRVSNSLVKHKGMCELLTELHRRILAHVPEDAEMVDLSQPVLDPQDQ